jgi:hypothetical protein
VQSVNVAGVPDPTPATADFTVELPVAALLHAGFTHTARTTGVKALTISGVPRGGTVSATCRGHGCPFHGPKTFKAKARVAKLTDGFKKAKLRTRAVVEITVAAPGATTKVFRLTFRTPPANPRVAILCVPPGSAQAQDCGAD